MIEVGETEDGYYVVFNTLTGAILPVDKPKYYRRYKRALRARNRRVKSLNKTMRNLTPQI